MTSRRLNADRRVALVLVLVMMATVVGHTFLMAMRVGEYSGIPLQVREWANVCTVEMEGR